MNVNSPANVSGLAWLCAADMWDRYLDVDYITRGERFVTHLGPGWEGLDEPEYGNLPYYSIWRQGSAWVVIVRGTRTQSQALSQVNSWGMVGRYTADQGCGRAMRETAATLYNSLLQLGVRSASRLILFGHSFGGEIVTALIKLYRGDITDPRPTVITIGAPRSIVENGVSAFSNVDMRRYQYVNDLFPRLPFQGIDAPFVQFTVGILERSNWARFRHVGNGVTLNSSGAVDLNELPPYNLSYPTTGLLGIVTTDNGTAVVNHSPDTYRDALLALATAEGSLDYQPTVNVPPIAPGPPEPPHVPMTDAQLETSLNVVETARIAASLGVGRQTPFKYQRFGRLHCMVCDGAIISASRYRKTAQSNARFWNQVWKKWNAVEFGGMPALLTAINKNFVA